MLAQMQNWDLVRQLPPQKQVLVVIDKDRFHGRIQTVSEDTIVIETKGQSKSIAKSDIRRVGIRTGSARGKNAGIGTGIGFGVGFAIGLALATPLDVGNTGFGPAVGLLGALIGTGIGAAIPGYTTIYKRN